MKVRIKATNEVVDVQDFGVKFHPRYWTEDRGYRASELEFEGFV